MSAAYAGEGTADLSRPDPTHEQMRKASSGKLFRRTGYQNVVAVLILAADRMRHAERSEAKARDVESCRR
jgi:hypothetical protein